MASTGSRLVPGLLATVTLLLRLYSSDAFCPDAMASRRHHSLVSAKAAVFCNDNTAGYQQPERIAEASQVLSDWDRIYNIENASSLESETKNADILRPKLQEAIQTLNKQATAEREADATKGRCMLGICASSTSKGVSTLKSWVTHLELPRGLLHGMDKDGVPLELNGAVYIKYNSGGVYSFADIRKSQLGFDALWKPGDAMLAEYDGIFRGVYFQVELSDGEFRQYLVPLDTFGD